MELIKDPQKPMELSTSAAIGNFDGLHLGHQEIIELLKKIAEKKSSSTCIVTFEPHPQKVLANKEVSLIYPKEEKYRLLEKFGVDYTICLNFTKELSNLSGEDFVKEILVDKLRIRDIVVGPDFMFGKNRSGNSDLLMELGDIYGFETMVVQPKVIDGDVISSSLIRRHISEGNIDRVNQLLGYRYYLKGTIVEGEKRGRLIGFPTTNIDTTWETLPRSSVYATYAYLDDNKYESITNVGYRPTFGKKELLVETHIFDFSEDVYGKSIKVEFVKRLRDEIKFDGVEALTSQIKIDVENVKKILEGVN